MLVLVCVCVCVCVCGRSGCLPPLIPPFPRSTYASTTSFAHPSESVAPFALPFARSSVAKNPGSTVATRTPKRWTSWRTHSLYDTIAALSCEERREEQRALEERAEGEGGERMVAEKRCV